VLVRESALAVVSAATPASRRSRDGTSVPSALPHPVVSANVAVAMNMLAVNADELDMEGLSE